MGKPDIVLNAYMKDSNRVRSVLEYYLGEKLPEDWEWAEMRGLYPARDSKGKQTFRQRDIMGKACAWGTHFFLGLENQDKVNLIFPWRLMEMDCLAYGEEIDEIRTKNRCTRRNYGKEDDFLYCYGREDRMEPVLNLILYWGKEQWDWPFSLRDMMEGMSALPPKMKRLVGNYEVQVIHMRSIPEKALEKMDSDLKYVLGMLRRAGCRKEYWSYIQENREFFCRIPKSALNVIDAYINIGEMHKYMEFEMNMETGEEEADMCKALQDLQKEAMKKGVKQGLKEGISQGITQGITQGIQLVQCLLADGRQEDVARAADDELYRKKLLAEYGMKELYK